MGALTLKPSAYVSRPWETTEVTRNLHGETLVYHVRGTRVVKVTGPGWLTDRTRFSYDGFRRQRLVTPLVGGVTATWAAALAGWWTLMGTRPNWVFQTDGSTSADFGWLFKLYTRLGDRRGRPARVGRDVSLAVCHVYHGAYGLPGVTLAGVAFPGELPHEGVLPGPTRAAAFDLTVAGVNLFAPSRGYSLTPPGELSRPAGPARALFRVSPLQRVLAGW